jgi:chloride channel protein, CIC family
MNSDVPSKAGAPLEGGQGASPSREPGPSVRIAAGAAEPEPLAWWAIVLCGLLVGVISGCGAVVFRAMIGGFHNLLFLGRLSLAYDANVHTPSSPWGAGIILVPIVGAVGVAFLVNTFAPEAKGHGVPEVMDAIYYGDGRIRPIVALIKSLASALSIGSGGSVGREGPIIQVGAAFGSTLGQMIAMPARQRVLLIAAGAGGGIAATFNTPIGGIAFAAELMLPSVTAPSLLIVALASVTATYIGRAAFGAQPSFNVPSLSVVQGAGQLFPGIVWIFPFGVLVGMLAWLFTRGIYWFEDRFDAMPGNYYTRHISGMLLVGLIMYGFMTMSESAFAQPNHYYIEGVGYATIMDILRSGLTAANFLLLLAAAKLLVTCLTLGSGASGGVFSPSMFLGATFGAGFGATLQHFVGSLPMSPAHFAYAGMAAMVGGTTGAVLTGTIMIFEMTRDYSVILPVILTVALATATRNWLSPSTIYTLKLLRRGDIVPQGLQARMAPKTGGAMSTHFLLLPTEREVDVEAVRQALLLGQVVVIADPGGQVTGVIDERRLTEASGETPTATASAHVLADADALLDATLRAISAAGARLAVVTRSAQTGGRQIVGVITERDIARLAYAEARLAD